METIKRLISQAEKGNFRNIYPIAYIDGIIDKTSKEKLSDILVRYNSIYIPWQGDVKSTRNRVNILMRRKGLWITYVTDKDEIVSEIYKGLVDDITKDDNWSADINWETVAGLDYIRENASKIPNGAVLPKHLSPSLQQLISESKTITNLVDDEDLESTNNVIKFKDKEYNKELASGLGRKILRKNWVEGKNVLTQEMINKSNTEYVIRYDFDLNGAGIDIQENCILIFDGGSLSNGTIIGKNTSIISPKYQIFKDIEINGTYSHDYFYPQWFGYFPNDKTQDAAPFIRYLASHRLSTFWSKGTWYLSPVCLAGVGYFSIVGSEEDSTDSRTKFVPMDNTPKHYLIKFGGKEDFSYVDNYKQYFCEHFVFKHITIVSTSNLGGFINHSTENEVYEFAALCFDNAVTGRVSAQFQVSCPAIFIRTSWEIIFDNIMVYYGGIGDYNKNEPKIIFGKANSVGSSGSSVNACSFNHLWLEAFPGPAIYANPKALFSHNNIADLHIEVDSASMLRDKGTVNYVWDDKVLSNIYKAIKDNTVKCVPALIDIHRAEDASMLSIATLYTNSMADRVATDTDNNIYVWPCIEMNQTQSVSIATWEESGGCIQFIKFSASSGKILRGHFHLGALTQSSRYTGKTLSTSDLLFITDNTFNVPQIDCPKGLVKPQHIGIMIPYKIYTGEDFLTNFGTEGRTVYLQNIINSGNIIAPEYGDSVLYKLFFGNWYKYRTRNARMRGRYIFIIYNNENKEITITVTAQLIRNEVWVNEVKNKITIPSKSFGKLVVQPSFDSSVNIDDIEHSIYFTTSESGIYNCYMVNALYELAEKPSGTTEARPENAYIGNIYFDSTLNKPIWFNGSKWVDAAGTEV